MSRRSVRLVPSVKRDDEIWTEEEVMEFGLAGEEEFCDMQVPFAVEETAVVEDMAAVEETTTYEEEDVSTYAQTAGYEETEADIVNEQMTFEPQEAVFDDSTVTKSGRVCMTFHCQLFEQLFV